MTTERSGPGHKGRHAQAGAGRPHAHGRRGPGRTRGGCACTPRSPSGTRFPCLHCHGLCVSTSPRAGNQPAVHTTWRWVGCSGRGQGSPPMCWLRSGRGHQAGACPPRGGGPAARQTRHHPSRTWGVCDAHRGRHRGRLRGPSVSRAVRRPQRHPRLLREHFRDSFVTSKARGAGRGRGAAPHSPALRALARDAACLAARFRASGSGCPRPCLCHCVWSAETFAQTGPSRVVWETFPAPYRPPVGGESLHREVRLHPSHTRGPSPRAHASPGTSSPKHAPRPVAGTLAGAGGRRGPPRVRPLGEKGPREPKPPPSAPPSET